MKIESTNIVPPLPISIRKNYQRIAPWIKALEDSPEINDNNNNNDNKMDRSGKNKKKTEANFQRLYYYCYSQHSSTLTAIKTKTKTGTKSSAAGTFPSTAIDSKFIMVVAQRQMQETLSLGVLYAARADISA